MHSVCNSTPYHGANRHYDICDRSNILWPVELSQQKNCFLPQVNLGDASFSIAGKGICSHFIIYKHFRPGHYINIKIKHVYLRKL